jgi:hypothetical protein
VKGTLTAADVVGPAAQGITAQEETRFAELIALIRAGKTYVNVHSAKFPGGAIRGQIDDNNEGENEDEDDDDEDER